jgi:DUF1680 family protein
VNEPVTLDLRYVKNRDKYKFDRSGRYPSDGQFYVALQDGKKENLEKVVLDLPEEAKGKTVSVMICKKNQKTSLGYNEISREPKQPPVVSVEHNKPNFKKEKL